MSTEIFSLDDVDYTIVHGWQVTGNIKLILIRVILKKSLEFHTQSNDGTLLDSWDYHLSRTTNWGTIRYYRHDRTIAITDIIFILFQKAWRFHQEVK